ncbi:MULTISPECIES: RNA-binding S4 domain-containing protein [Rothia]|uniref:RNA-binding S4 domain-containing protein n=1 Tax=Rothia TaxID=32207 RepID=UPI0015D76E63|nr:MULTISPECIES: RNA-binding S4 domain-containing protein [Rothia]
MSIESVVIRDEMIRLGQFLKLASLVENGVHARQVIQDGLVKVNGEICEQRGRQLHAGDTVELNGLTVQVETE